MNLDLEGMRAHADAHGVVSLTPREFDSLLVWVQAAEADAANLRLVAAAAIQTIARVEALAEKWNSTPDYDPTEYDQGRVDQRHDMTTELLVALAPESDGGEGRG